MRMFQRYSLLYHTFWHVDHVFQGRSLFSQTKIVSLYKDFQAYIPHDRPFSILHSLIWLKICNIWIIDCRTGWIVAMQLQFQHYIICSTCWAHESVSNSSVIKIKPKSQASCGIDNLLLLMNVLGTRKLHVHMFQTKETKLLLRLN